MKSFDNHRFFEGSPSGGYWVRRMRQSPQAPLDFKGPPLKTAYTVLDSLSGRFGVKTFFFFFLENTLILGEKYPSPDQTSFFSQTT